MREYGGMVYIVLAVEAAVANRRKNEAMIFYVRKGRENVGEDVPDEGQPEEIEMTVTRQMATRPWHSDSRECMGGLAAATRFNSLEVEA